LNNLFLLGEVIKMGLSRNIKIFITLGIVLFAGSSLLVGLLSGQSEGPDLVQSASAETDAGIPIISISPATSVTITPTVDITSPTTVQTTTIVTIKPTTTQTTTATIIADMQQQIKENFRTGEGNTAKGKDGYYGHFVRIENRKEDPFIGTITLSCVHKGKKEVASFDVNIPGYWYTTIDFPGSSDQMGMVGTKIESFTRA
jgi:hypothetical protein